MGGGEGKPSIDDLATLKEGYQYFLSDAISPFVERRKKTS